MYHSLFDYQDQNTNYSNKPINTNSSNNLNSMKKGTMVNGSEVYYGKGKKVDTRTQPRNGIHDMKRINKKISNNRNNQIGHNKSIQYTSKEEVKTIKKVVVNKKVENYDENLVDLSKPHCFISVRMFDGSVLKTEFNTDKKLRDIYSMVKKFGKYRIGDFVLLDGFPPRPLLEFNKTIEELGLENSMLTQKTDMI